MANIGNHVVRLTIGAALIGLVVGGSVLAYELGRVLLYEAMDAVDRWGWRVLAAPFGIVAAYAVGMAAQKWDERYEAKRKPAEGVVVSPAKREVWDDWGPVEQ